MRADLRQLAELHGIALSYHDARGQFHELDEPGLCQFLTGMGVLELDQADDEAPAGGRHEAGDRAGAWARKELSDDALAQALEDERAALWRIGVPPVHVMSEQRAAHVELIVPELACEAVWHWEIMSEDSRHLEGTIVPTQLQPAGNPDDYSGWNHAHSTLIEGQPRQRFCLPVPALAPGYYTLRISLLDSTLLQVFDARFSSTLIVAPRRCFTHKDKRLWGVALQLYAVRSTRNWGIGDFTDLQHAGTQLAALGADLVGINPLHALFPDRPEEASPYSPSSRQWLNPLYIDVERLPEFRSTDMPAILGKDWQLALQKLRDADWIDYTEVTRCKGSVLEHLFERFELSGKCQRAVGFAEYRLAGGEALENFARFEVLQEEYQLSHTGQDVHEAFAAWSALRRDEPVWERFIQTHARRITFHTWLQWVADTQLQQAEQHLRAQGMQVGLYRDLAVGAAAIGADVWSTPELYLQGVSVGAPPDDFSTRGQDWGLPPWKPRALRESGYEPFITMLRSNMMCAGALRIDHVMGLQRLFWIPPGRPATAGTYVHYPIDEFLAIVALESQRQRCEIIGEDLGTVPDGLRERLADAGMLSYRLLYFEKHYDGDGSFIQPQNYPEQALVGANTHDLPTLKGFWSAHDLALCAQLGLYSSPDMQVALQAARDEDRTRLLHWLIDTGLWTHEGQGDTGELPDMNEPLVQAVYAALASTPCRFVLANIEDLLGQLEQINLPGTDRDRYPNWRRRLSVPIERWSEHEPLRGCLAAIEHNRVR